MTARVTPEKRTSPRVECGGEAHCLADVMITLTTKTQIAGVTAKQITDFLLEPTDESYQRWWPGTHLRFHDLKRVNGYVGNIIYMDEIVGKRRIRMAAEVVEAKPARKIVWRMRKGVPLPAYVILELQDERDGAVAITHTIRAGLDGAGRIFDPFLRLYFSPSFCRDVDEHVKVEFIKLVPLLQELRSA